MSHSPTSGDLLKPIKLLDHIIEAKQARVYNAWTDLTVFQQWFCPSGFSIAKAEMDVRPGGYFSIHMKSPEGDIYPTKGKYISLDPPSRIIYQDSWDDDRKNNEPVLTEVVLQSEGEHTKLSLYSSFVSEEQKEKILSSDIVNGWKMFFENLNRILK